MTGGIHHLDLRICGTEHAWMNSAQTVQGILTTYACRLPWPHFPALGSLAIGLSGGTSVPQFLGPRTFQHSSPLYKENKPANDESHIHPIPPEGQKE